MMNITPNLEPILEMDYIRSRQEIEITLTIKKHKGEFNDDQVKRLKNYFAKGVACLGGHIYKNETRYGIFFIVKKGNASSLVMEGITTFGIDKKRITKDIKEQMLEVLNGQVMSLELPLFNDKKRSFA